jgi:ABC-type bacteriocin/lantibiotic exporter with double-glycine peptidase domain
VTDAGLRRAGLLALAVAGCAGMRPYDEGPAPSAVVLDVPHASQGRGPDCGFAALEMLSGYYGVQIPDEEAAAVRREAEGGAGVSGATLRRALERSGFRVFIFPGEILDEQSPRGIAYHLRRGRPLVVMVSARRRRFHYTVVSGLDAERGHVILEDPQKGRASLGLRSFRELWERANRFTLLAVPEQLRGRESSR